MQKQISAAIADSIRIDTSIRTYSKWGKEKYKAKMKVYRDKYHDLYTKNMVTPYNVKPEQIKAHCEKMMKGFEKAIDFHIKGDWLRRFEYPELSTAADFKRCTYKPIYGYLITANIFDYVEVQKATMKNLKAKGFPCVDDVHMMLRTSESNKQVRRNKVLETHEIVILMGDNLNDFTDLFDKKSQADRSKIVAEL